MKYGILTQKLSYWNDTPKIVDLNLAETLWLEMIEGSEDFSVVDSPNIPIKAAQEYSDAESLIRLHLFCVDGLCDEQIRTRLAEEREFEGEPVRFDGQHLSGYHWWLYPNYDDGIYSKAFARANVAGDLVVGTGEDTCFVCIRHGRLTLSRQVSDAVVSDARLLVCL